MYMNCCSHRRDRGQQTYVPSRSPFLWLRNNGGSESSKRKIEELPLYLPVFEHPLLADDKVMEKVKQKSTVKLYYCIFYFMIISQI